jgi:hypothetical protein
MSLAPAPSKGEAKPGGCPTDVRPADRGAKPDAAQPDAAKQGAGEPGI